MQTKKIRLELEERQMGQARLLVSAIGKGIMKNLKEKEEQIQRMGKLNWLLQEKLNSLEIENKLWRNLAQTNEAEANYLRTNLAQVLAHIAADQRVSGAALDDAESCGDNGDCGWRDTEAEWCTLAGGGSGGWEGVKDKEVVGGGGGGDNCGDRMLCRKCGERESCVLLMPCRHLCLCNICGSTFLHACPVCNSNVTASIHINMA